MEMSGQKNNLMAEDADMKSTLLFKYKVIIPY